MVYLDRSDRSWSRWSRSWSWSSRSSSSSSSSRAVLRRRAGPAYTKHRHPQPKETWCYVDHADYTGPSPAQDAAVDHTRSGNKICLDARSRSRKLESLIHLSELWITSHRPSSSAIAPLQLRSYPTSAGYHVEKFDILKYRCFDVSKYRGFNVIEISKFRCIEISEFRNIEMSEFRNIQVSKYRNIYRKIEVSMYPNI